MHNEQITESNQTQWRYIPVPTPEAQIEDYLDHVCAPLIGVISYEERQRIREAKRRELEATIQAHLELGSTREQAVALTLSAQTLPASNAKHQIVLPVQKQEISVAVTAWHKTQQTAFALATGNALIGLPIVLTVAHRIQPHYYTWDLRLLAMVGLPAAAGFMLGYNSYFKAAKGWIRASLLTTPLIALSYMAYVWAFWSHSFRYEFWLLLGFSVVHSAVSALSGSVGTWFGRLFRKRIAPLLCLDSNAA